MLQTDHHDSHSSPTALQPALFDVISTDNFIFSQFYDSWRLT